MSKEQRISTGELRQLMLLVPRETGVVHVRRRSGRIAGEIEGFVVPVFVRDTETNVVFDGRERTSVAQVVECIHRMTVGEFGIALKNSVISDDDEGFLPVTSPWGDAWLIWDSSSWASSVFLSSPL